MCRVTQMGLLRMLTIQPIMGVDVLKRKDAWRVVDKFRGDDRVRWSDEPSDLETAWRVLSARNDVSHKLWTDDYLAAFAQTADLRFTTLDTRFAKRYPSVEVETLI